MDDSVNREGAPTPEEATFGVLMAAAQTLRDELDCEMTNATTHAAPACDRLHAGAPRCCGRSPCSWRPSRICRGASRRRAAAIDAGAYGRRADACNRLLATAIHAFDRAADNGGFARAVALALAEAHAGGVRVKTETDGAPRH